MKRKNIITIAAVIFIAACFIRPIILDNLLAFIFLGLIPGTNLSIPSWIMLIGYAVVFVFTLRWLIHQPLYIGSSAKQEKTAKQLARKRIIKKTTQARRTNRKTVKAKA